VWQKTVHHGSICGLMDIKENFILTLLATKMVLTVADTHAENVGGSKRVFCGKYFPPFIAKHIHRREYKNELIAHHHRMVNIKADMGMKQPL